MAASTAELILKFTGDPRHLKETLAQVRADLAQTGQGQIGSQKQVTTNIIAEWKRQEKAVQQSEASKLRSFQQSITQIDRAEQRRIADSIRSANQRLREEQRTAREVARIMAETARQAERQERIRERAAKRIADTQIREAKRTAKELEKSLGQKDTGSRGGPSIDDLSGPLASVPAVGRLASQLSSVTTATQAAGASTAALAAPIALVITRFVAETGATIALTKALFDVTKQTADYKGRLFDMSQQLGVSVELLSAFEVLATTTGGSIDTVAGSLAIFQRNLEDARDPTSEEAKLLEELNVTARDTEGALRQTLAGLFALGEGAKQTDATLQLFGRSGRFINAILKESNGNIDEAIKRFRELGIEISTQDAKAADQFNDSLAELNFQVRAAIGLIGQELIPIFLDIVRATGEVVTAFRPLISLFALSVRIAFTPVASAMKGLSLNVKALTGDYEGLKKAIREASEEQQIQPLAVPDLRSPLPAAPSARQAATDAVNEAEAIVSAVKRSVDAQNQALDTLFQKGRRTREQLANETIAGNKKILDADKQRIDAQLALREQEIKALDAEQEKRGEIVKRDTDQYRSITAQIVKLQQERLDKENEFEISSKAIRAKAAKERADSTRNQVANETDLLINELDRQIKETEARIKRGAIVEADGLTIIEQLEQAKIEARRQSLEKQKDIGFLTIQNQTDLNNEIQKLNQEADRLADEQRARRLQREADSAQRSKEIKLAEIDTTLELQRIVGERTIATIESLADLRKKTEEQAAREILQVKLDLIDQEISATEAKLKAAASIADVEERTQAQAELNNQLKILTEQRISIEAEGRREIDEGRQRDLENERRYADELRRIKEEIVDVERDAARAVIELMRLGHASSRQIIKAQTKIDIDDENARHKRALETISNLQQENRESKKTAEEKLETEKELNRLREAEEERHQLTLQGIKKRAKQEEILAGPFGGFDFGLKSGQLIELEQGVQSFADVAKVALSAVGAVVNQLALGIGNLVQQWVLLGTTGPGAFRKLVASVLAGVAAQAATLAVMELAYGIAALTPWGAAIYGPAAAHFKAAALFGAVAVGAGLAGRAAAGNLFQDKTDRFGGGGSGPSDRGELNPLNLARNGGTGGQRQIAPQIQPRRVEVRVTVAEGRFADAIKTTVVEDINNAGPIREVIGNDGNLNRG